MFCALNNACIYSKFDHVQYSVVGAVKRRGRHCMIYRRLQPATMPESRDLVISVVTDGQTNQSLKITPCTCTWGSDLRYIYIKCMVLITNSLSVSSSKFVEVWGWGVKSASF